MKNGFTRACALAAVLLASSAQAQTVKVGLVTTTSGIYATLGDQIDAVIIATPLDTHYQLTMDALAAKKWVFCEKTMVQTIEQGRDVVKKCHEIGKFVQVGHQRHYNPKYNLAMDLVYGKGYLGRITHVTAQWHRNTNWRRNWQETFDERGRFWFIAWAMPRLRRHRGDGMSFPTAQAEAAKRGSKEEQGSSDAQL
mgnify:CR=1 FL=1